MVLPAIFAFVMSAPVIRDLVNGVTGVVRFGAEIGGFLASAFAFCANTISSTFKSDNLHHIAFLLTLIGFFIILAATQLL